MSDEGLAKDISALHVDGRHVARLRGRRRQVCATVLADNSRPLYFSATGITAIPVASEQIVQVKVTFTFS
ncbi:hypothetical protein [Granulicella rosea]|uniref:hypothetical protein n=1 Tax=Granulicella rosea TaxID=474952 RepID=UPI00115C897F|nr:hypothetical protein [Granulicella rosea]